MAQALVDEVRRRLAEAASPEDAVAMQRYMKSAMPFRGIKSAPLRRICAEIFVAHPLATERALRSAVLSLWDDASFREERYAAIQLTGHRLYVSYQRPGALDLYHHLIVTGAWWDLVDVLASNRVGPILFGFPSEVTPTIRSWAVDTDLWLRRTAVICQLGAKEDTDLDLLRYALEQNLEDSPYGREFFIRKALGWALRQHARVDPDWVRAFVDEHADRLSGLSIREALKHLG